MNPLNGSAQRLSKFMVQNDAGAPFEERVPFGTPDWALYGSIPARAVTHVLARPVLDAMEHTHNVLTGKVDPWADLGPTGMMAGLVAGGGLVPGAAPKGAMRTGFSGGGSPPHPVLQKFMLPSGQQIPGYDLAEFLLNNKTPLQIAKMKQAKDAGTLNAAPDFLDALDAVYAHHQQHGGKLPSDAPGGFELAGLVSDEAQKHPFLGQFVGKPFHLAEAQDLLSALEGGKHSLEPFKVEFDFLKNSNKPEDKAASPYYQVLEKFIPWFENEQKMHPAAKGLHPDVQAEAQKIANLIQHQPGEVEKIFNDLDSNALPPDHPYVQAANHVIGWFDTKGWPQPPKLKPFGDQEFMTHGGEYADTFTDPAHIAAAALHHAGGDAGKAHDLLMGQIGKWMDQGEDPEAFHFAIDALRDAKGLPQLHALSPQDIAYVNSIPEQSNVNPYKALADLKAGKISTLPQHQHVAVGNAGKDWGAAGVEGADWEPSEAVVNKLHSALFGTHPLDKSVMAPSVLRRPIPQAITPYNWELSTNASPELRSFNINHPRGQWMLDDPRYVRDAIDMGFNLAHPIVKGMDPSKWVVPEAPWEYSGTNPANRGPGGRPDLFGEAFSHPGPGRGKERENALFGADTPIVSNEYTKHWGDTNLGAQNVLGWLRSGKAGQVFWPEINHGRRGYDSTVMHNVIQEMLNQDYDLLALHGMDDLGGTHTQYAWATPEQFRAIGAQFNPDYKDFPNMLLSQGSPFGLSYMKEPENDRSNPLARKGRTRTQTGR